MADAVVCPVAATADYLTRIEWGGQSEEFVFSETARPRLHALIKWSVSCNGLETSRFGVHSLRSGGPTACYVAGVPLGDIRRFGRWESCVFNRYIHRDELMYHNLSKYISRTEGFLDQLKQTNSATKDVRVVEEDDGANCRTGWEDTGRNKYEQYRTGSLSKRTPRKSKEPSSSSSVATREVTDRCFDSTLSGGKREVNPQVDERDEDNWTTDSSESAGDSSFMPDTRKQKTSGALVETKLFSTKCVDSDSAGGDEELSLTSEQDEELSPTCGGRASGHDRPAEILGMTPVIKIPPGQ